MRRRKPRRRPPVSQVEREMGSAEAGFPGAQAKKTKGRNLTRWSALPAITLVKTLR